MFYAYLNQLENIVSFVDKITVAIKSPAKSKKATIRKNVKPSK